MDKDTDPLRQFVFDNQLHADILTVARKKALITEAMVRLGKGRSTVYNAISKVRAGEGLNRKVRSDRGAFRALSPQALEALTDLVAASPDTSGAAACRYLRQQFPAESFCECTVRAAISAVRRRLDCRWGNQGV